MAGVQAVLISEFYPYPIKELTMRTLLPVLLATAVLLGACAPAVLPPAAQPPTVTALPAASPLTTSSASAAVSSSQQGPGGPGTTLIKPDANSTPASPSGAEVMTYRNATAGFSLTFPLMWQTGDENANPAVYNAAVAPGTTLVEKRFEVLTTDHATDCRETTYQSDLNSTSPQHVTINNIDFLKETGGGIGAGNIYDWTSYSVMKATTCITVTFVLHSVSAGVYSTEPAPFDKLAESQVFDRVINSFQFN